MSAIAGLKPALPETIVRFLNTFVLVVVWQLLVRMYFCEGDLFFHFGRGGKDFGDLFNDRAPDQPLIRRAEINVINP